ncbi:hypothetical protein Acr_14g0009790 [Actinidia rufa]|uniref:Uncharacterized protein n=1 Tax=Actinidia rufa TaxID=165716 RepID=A0A7J0FRZ7_9ERIC|nr:hypothetical protein Acr_14g0009790 [Actinidia rufa]
MAIRRRQRKPQRTSTNPLAHARRRRRRTQLRPTTLRQSHNEQQSPQSNPTVSKGKEVLGFARMACDFDRKRRHESAKPFLSSPSQPSPHLNPQVLLLR